LFNCSGGVHFRSCAFRVLYCPHCARKRDQTWWSNAGTDGKTKTATHHHFAAGPSPAPAPKAAAPPGTKEWNELVKKEFTEACGKMEKGETAKGMKSKLADALSLPRTPAQEVKIKALVKEVGLNEDDFAGTKFPHEISATVNDPASKLSGENFKKLCLGLRDILGGKAPAEAGESCYYRESYRQDSSRSSENHIRKIYSTV
jgi:hypothetical protein